MESRRKFLNGSEMKLHDEYLGEILEEFWNKSPQRIPHEPGKNPEPITHEYSKKFLKKSCMES